MPTKHIDRKTLSQSDYIRLNDKLREVLTNIKRNEDGTPLSCRYVEGWNDAIVHKWMLKEVSPKTTDTHVQGFRLRLYGKVETQDGHVRVRGVNGLNGIHERIDDLEARLRRIDDLEARLRRLEYDLGVLPTTSG
jgi:hypothetical protein